MPSVEARIRTDRASRYLVQFCRHAAAMGGNGEQAAAIHGTGEHGPGPHPPGGPAQHAAAHADWSDTHGVVTFAPGGRCTIDADDAALTVRVEATDEQTLLRIQDIVTRDLGRFSHRDPLTVDWHRPPAAGERPS
jgi:hypothetical protein